MDTAYIFSEPGSIRVPFLDYDPRLFRFFIARGGKWDGARHEFVLAGAVNAEQLCGNYLGIPFVLVKDQSPVPKVFGFFGRPWDERILGQAAVDNRRRAVDKPPILQCSAPVPDKEPFAFPRPALLPEKLSEHWLAGLEAELCSRKYSLQTRRAYIYYNRLICRTLQKTPEEIRTDDVTRFLADMEKSRDYSSSAMNLAISAIKFFFRNVLKNDSISEQHRPRHDKRLPMVLSKEEIKKILALEKNPKHRLLLMLVYSSGLRVSEVVALKREHIDLSRKVIYIRLGKGRKDRNTLLSEKAARFLEEYYDFFDIQKWLFPGQPSTRPLSIRSAQHIFDKALRRAGIEKKITIHGLRHTFATHLLESGTDIRYIQSLLGHATLRTTERYTHVARRSVLNIKSPLDTIL